MLESWAPQIGVSKHKSRKKEGKKGRGNICGQTTKSIVKEKTSIFYIEKGTRIL